MGRFGFVVTFAALLSAPAAAAPPLDAGVDAIVAALDDVARTEHAPPGMALVVVREGEPPLIRTWGVERAGSDAPLTPATPVYIASLTKAYTGVLAAELDRRGVLPLDATLDDIWPELAESDTFDAGAITLRDLLSHQAPIRNQTLGFRTAYAGEIHWGNYPRYLLEHTTAREPGFRYDNLGYLIYAAALERQTGRDWRAWLEAELFEPFALTGTRARATDDGAWGHAWTGSGFEPVAPKADTVMQPAGGLFATPKDAAAWIEIQLGARTADSGVTSDAVAASHEAAISYQSADPNNPCAAYGLGWHLCDLAGDRVIYHAGGYVGATAWTAVSLDHGAGVTVMFSSDIATDWLADKIVTAFAEAASGFAFSTPPETFAEGYAERFAEQDDSRRAERAAGRADARWGGWTWSPDDAALGDFVGEYHNARLGDAKVVRAQTGLEFRLGEYVLAMEPAAPDLFAGSARPLADLEALDFERGEDGAVTAVVWDGEPMRRSSDLGWFFGN